MNSTGTRVEVCQCDAEFGLIPARSRCRSLAAGPPGVSGVTGTEYCATSQAGVASGRTNPLAPRRLVDPKSGGSCGAAETHQVAERAGASGIPLLYITGSRQAGGCLAGMATRKRGGLEAVTVNDPAGSDGSSFVYERFKPKPAGGAIPSALKPDARRFRLFIR